MFKLKKNEYGKVNYLMRTGKDLVRSEMNPFSVQHIIDNGKVTETIDPKYPIAIDDTWFFEGEIIEDEAPSTPAETEDKPEEVQTPPVYGKFGKGAKRK